MTDEEDKEDVEDAGKDMTDDEEMSGEDDGSSVANQSASSNATSVGRRLGTSADQAVDLRQEYSSQVVIEIEQQMMIDKPVHSVHLASAFNDEQAIDIFSYLESLTLS